MSNLIRLGTWRQAGEDWHLLIGNKSVVRLIPSTDHPSHPGVTFWVSDIAEEYWSYYEEWDAVDFHPLAYGQKMMQLWWQKTAQRLHAY